MIFPICKTYKTCSKNFIRSLEPRPKFVFHQQFHNHDDLDGAHGHVRIAQD